MTKGKLFVISGPSGSGKSTVIREVFAKRDNLYFSVSATTREPRHGEVNGINYWFLDTQSFKKKIAEDGFLEYAQYVGNYYGTPVEPINEHIQLGEDVILDIEVQGALQIKEKVPDAVLIFVFPPSFAELERRLRGRKTENEKRILDRLETARKECEKADIYDYIVINDKVEQAAEEIMAIMSAEKCRTKNRICFIREV